MGTKRKKYGPPLPEYLWVMRYATYTMVGSVSHVDVEEQLYTSREACQAAIDGMESWLGMGDRDKYQPMRLLAPTGYTKVV